MNTVRNIPKGSASKKRHQISLRPLATRQAAMEFFTCSLPRISCRCRLTVWTLMDNVSAIPLLVNPLSIRSRTCLSLTDRIRLLSYFSNSVTFPLTELIITHWPGMSNGRGP